MISTGQKFPGATIDKSPEASGKTREAKVVRGIVALDCGLSPFLRVDGTRLVREIKRRKSVNLPRRQKKKRKGWGAHLR